MSRQEAGRLLSCIGKKVTTHTAEVVEDVFKCFYYKNLLRFGYFQIMSYLCTRILKRKFCNPHRRAGMPDKMTG